MMKNHDLLAAAQEYLNNPDSPEPDFTEQGEINPLARFVFGLIEENRAIKNDHAKTIDYLRKKIDQLLVVIGTIPLRPEELDNKSLISIDPIGIIAESFTQILDHLRQTNEKLELAMEEIHAIFESVGGGILVLDRNKQILSYNRQLLEMFSRPGESLLGKTCKDLICKGNPPQGCVIDEMNKSGKITVVSHCAGADHHYNIAATPIKDKTGEIARAVLLYTDISETVAAKYALAEEKERLSLTLESIAEGVVATDTEGNIVLMNRVAEKLSGWSFHEAFGKQVCDILTVFEEKEKKSCFELFRGVLRKKGRTERISTALLQDREGHTLSITISAAPIRHRHKEETTGTIFVFRDITHEKKMEEELARSSKIESLGVLAGGIAHDFNNLLTSILGNVAVAKRYTKPGEKIHQLLSDSEKASTRAKNLTRQLLTFAKGGSPIITLTSTRKLLIDSAHFATMGSKIKCEFSISDDLWNVEIDEGQIGQVIQNLVINADQAMPKGGIVTISAENIAISSSATLPLKKGKHIKIGIHDRGEGIDARYLDKIFDPYFTTKETGHGLGLAICYSIIKKHQGHITVEASQDGGSTFFIYLPATDSEAAAIEENPFKTMQGKGKILVMDDEDIVRDVAVQILAMLGYQVDECSDGHEAIKRYINASKDGHPYDAIIMDLTIPGGMGGKEAIEKLREIDPEVSAIVSSGYANDPIMSEYRSHGFQGVVPKPYDIEQLSSMVFQILQEKRQNQI
ncbi:MAG: PAS domain S-box protein [Pseudomonadota bacterium]